MILNKLLKYIYYRLTEWVKNIWGGFRAWCYRRYYLITGQFTREKFNEMESWAKRKWPKIDWENIHEVEITPQGVRITWFFKDWQRRFPGIGFVGEYLAGAKSPNFKKDKIEEKPEKN